MKQQTLNFSSPTSYHSIDNSTSKHSIPFNASSQVISINQPTFPSNSKPFQIRNIQEKPRKSSAIIKKHGIIMPFKKLNSSPLKAVKHITNGHLGAPITPVSLPLYTEGVANRNQDWKQNDASSDDDLTLNEVRARHIKKMKARRLELKKSKMQTLDQICTSASLKSPRKAYEQPPLVKKIQNYLNIDRELTREELFRLKTLYGVTAKLCTSYQIDRMPKEIKDKVLERKAVFAERARWKALSADEKKAEMIKRRKERIALNAASKPPIIKYEIMDEKFLDASHLKPLPDPKPVDLPTDISVDMFGEIVMLAEFVSAYVKLFSLEGDQDYSIASIMTALTEGERCCGLLASLLECMLSIFLEENDDLEDSGFELSKVAITKYTVSDLLRAVLTNCAKKLDASVLEDTDFSELSPRIKLHFLIEMLHLIMDSEAIAEQLTELRSNLKHIFKKRIALQSEFNALAKETKVKGSKNDSTEKPEDARIVTRHLLANMPELKMVKVREDRDRLIKEYDEMLDKLNSSLRITPLGMDRDHCRYWVFNSVSGLFVERGWVNSEMEWSPDISLLPKNENDESFSSNDSSDFESNHDENTVSSPVHSYQNSLFEEITRNLENSTTSPIKDEKPAIVNFNSNNDVENNKAKIPNKPNKFLEQIDYWKKPCSLPSQGQNVWFKYDSLDQLEELIDSLCKIGERESLLRKELIKRKASIKFTSEETASKPSSANQTIASFYFSPLVIDLYDIFQKLTTAELCKQNSPSCDEWSQQIQRAEPNPQSVAPLFLKLLSFIWPKFLKGIFLPSEEDSSTISHSKSGADVWISAVENAYTWSRLYILLDVLDSSIRWENSARNAKCRVCHKLGDKAKLLLCDGCNAGYHIYCLRPKLYKVPNGDWHCVKCKKRSPVKRLRDDESSSDEDIEEPTRKLRTRRKVIESSSEDESEEESLQSEINHESNCHVCQEDVDLDDIDIALCSTCPNAFHRFCHDPRPPSRRKPDWTCIVCLEGPKRRRRETRNRPQRTNHFAKKRKISEVENTSKLKNLHNQPCVKLVSISPKQDRSEELKRVCGGYIKVVSEELEIMNKIIADLRNKMWSSLFENVQSVEAYKHLKHKTDFTSISESLEDSNYNWQQFNKDLATIVNNALICFDEGEKVYGAALKMDNRIQNLLSNLPLMKECYNEARITMSS